MSKTILLIDDDPTIIKIVETFLKSHDYQVAIANDGQEGINKVNERMPDLIILDVQMPKMNGYTFIFELKKIIGAKLLPIIVLTAKDGMAEIFKIEGVKEYLTKPVSPEKLLESVKKLI